MKNPKTIISIIVLVMVSIFAVGTAYAFFTANVEGAESSQTISVAGGSLSITVNGGNNINIGNIVPSYDPIATKTITLSGTNTTDLIMRYSMSLEIENNTFSNNAISYTLESINTSVNGEVIPSISTNQGIATGSSSIDLGMGNYETGNNLIHTYYLNLYFLETESDQNIEQGETISGYVKVEEVEPSSWAKPWSGTLLKAIKDSNAVTDTITVPGRDISNADEALLASTADDYGISYYFRGAVENNYVEFAGMCWRIVRVTGDSSIKLVLYNNNQDGVANPCTVSSSSGAFARYSGTTYTSAFNTSYTRNAYVGFMYGKGSTYALEHANNTKSTILTNLETWYELDSKFASYENMLVDTIWCNDKSHYSGNGYGTNPTNYKAYQRLNPAASANPSLVCPNDSDGGKLSKFMVADTENGNGTLKYKIGLLTADEVAYAGGIFKTDNSTYYLNKNATDTWWWSLSPYHSYAAGAGVWIVLSAGYLSNIIVYNTGGLRPAVSLVSTTKITGGNGTISSPYII